MRTFCAVLLMVGLAGCAWGQSVPSMFYAAQDSHWGETPKPLKCGKGQHVESKECGPASSSDGTEMTWCFGVKPHCVKNAEAMHSVTEKDWQELLARLKALEKQVQGKDGAHF